ncbi:D-2-hydroxyacid dehydrogenase [Sporomusa acidovorans]|uniref:Glyoxylate/hydroxypyruvate reductase B n=1 Tax=Sporomusa acidovorans (strain ATCC 49682 / DSM 3132 / Mol) TaxID=1123286 RepID=A0ABZ3J4L9_SPOA4|nr:D-2-hydroxyacid dehydrogenase [Sporomusa acidovorans]OZC23925.1 glycerate dehydrogenase [Sporomusa acidovorans DSM 3132]SDF31245.1 Phosphoglycerate dehydrogenase [Sporomusa acidovorans]
MAVLNIVVLNPLADRHKEMIKAAEPNVNIIVSDQQNALEHMPVCHILATWGWAETRDLYQAAPHLEWIHSLSAGVEKLIFPEIQAADTVLTNSKGIHGIAVSEHVLAMILAFSRGLTLSIRQQDAKLWKRVPTIELHEHTLAIIGLGSIGREIAKKAKALGMNVLASKQELTTELFVDKLYPSDPESLLEMLAQADFVTVALPLTESTQNLIGLTQFKAMKPSAYFFNIARGAIVNEADLITALEQKLIAGAGLDVFSQEPLPESSPLWGMPNVIITPHVAALSPAYLDRAVKLFADNLIRFIQGREMINIVDKTKGY